MARSKVITLNLSAEEYFLVSNYVEYTPTSLSDFLTRIVNNYLLLTYTYPDRNKSLVEELKRTLEIKKIQYKEELHKTSVRIPKDDLLYWDVYCDNHYLSRTALIRKSISAFFFTRGRKLGYRFQEKLEKVVYNIILGTGSISYNELRIIFKDIDPKILTNILNDGETKGFIGRKGAEGDTYVPTMNIQKAGGKSFLFDLISRVV